MSQRSGENVIYFLFFVSLFFTAGRELTGLELRSPAFREGKEIPSKYACDGKNISPPLQWMDVPEDTVSFALICTDPDARSTWTHWTIYNIPAESTNLVEGIAKREQLPNGTRQGVNDFGKVGYGGPCPPRGIHRYVFTLYALDDELSLSARATRKDLEKAIQGHILDEAKLIGTYRRK